MLTCAIGNPPPPAAAQAPQDQATPLSLLVTSFSFLSSLIIVCNNTMPERSPGEGRASAPHCHGEAIIGAAGNRCTLHGQPHYPAVLVHTHLHQINACPLILRASRPLYQPVLSASVQPRKNTVGRRTERRYSAESLRFSHCPARKRPRQGGNSVYSRR